MWFKLGPLKWCVDGDCVDLYDCFARKYVNEVLSLSSIIQLINFKYI